MPETAYATCGDLSLAYLVFGNGPTELVFVGPMVSHVELLWTLPEFKSFFDQLGTFCRVALFDKAALGLSDPIARVRTLDERAAEIEAIMDAVGFTRPAIFGMSEGGPSSILFAATRPERTRALILYGTYTFMSVGWDDLDCEPSELVVKQGFRSAMTCPRRTSTHGRKSRSRVSRKWHVRPAFAGVAAKPQS